MHTQGNPSYILRGAEGLQLVPADSRICLTGAEWACARLHLSYMSLLLLLLVVFLASRIRFEGLDCASGEWERLKEKFSFLGGAMRLGATCCVALASRMSLEFGLRMRNSSCVRLILHATQDEREREQMPLVWRLNLSSSNRVLIRSEFGRLVGFARHFGIFPCFSARLLRQNS